MVETIAAMACFVATSSKKECPSTRAPSRAKNKEPIVTWSESKSTPEIKQNTEGVFPQELFYGIVGMGGAGGGSYLGSKCVQTGRSKSNNMQTRTAD